MIFFLVFANEKFHQHQKIMQTHLKQKKEEKIMKYLLNERGD